MKGNAPLSHDAAVDQINQLFAAPDRAFVIHYALQQLRREQSELAPPVAAIAVSNLASAQIRVFSIKAEADKAGIDLAHLAGPDQLTRLEYSLLYNFNDFLSEHPTHDFLHWYMRDESFGFAALEHRYRKVLADVTQTLYGARSVAPAVAFGFGGNSGPYPVRIPEHQKIDLARLIRDIYGAGPISLRELADRNGLSHAELIAGENEPGAFESGNHARLQWSTTTKTRLIAEIGRLVANQALVVSRPARQRADGEIRVFINYRREDTEAAAGRLHDKLVLDFGEDNVFFDTDDIPAGADFEAVLRQQIDACDVALVVIGRRWATIEDAAGVPRLHTHGDFVRSEIAAALVRGKLVIPVLVDGAALPAAHQLPGDIAALVRKQKLDIRNSQFATDAENLVAQIRKSIRMSASQNAMQLTQRL